MSAPPTPHRASPAGDAPALLLAHRVLHDYAAGQRMEARGAATAGYRDVCLRDADRAVQVAALLARCEARGLDLAALVAAVERVPAAVAGALDAAVGALVTDAGRVEEHCRRTHRLPTCRACRAESAAALAAADTLRALAALLSTLTPAPEAGETTDA